MIFSRKIQLKCKKLSSKVGFVGLPQSLHMFSDDRCDQGSKTVCLSVIVTSAIDSRDVRKIILKS